MRKGTVVYKGIFKTTFAEIKRKSHKRKIKFLLTIEYIGDLFEIQEGKCALTGLQLVLKKSTRDTSQTASLDRKDSLKGYEIGNVQWVHKDVNRMKSNLHEDIFINLCKKISIHKKDSDSIKELATLFGKINKLD